MVRILTEYIIDLALGLKAKDNGFHDDSVHLDIRSSFHENSEDDIEDFKKRSKELEAAVLSKKSQISIYIMKQLARIVQEFKVERYADRFDTTIEKVTKALVAQELNFNEICNVLNGTRKLKILL